MANETLSMSSLAGLEIRRVEERSSFLNMSIYGEAGVGKTVLGGSASVVEGMYPVLNIDLEGGSESLRRTYPDVEVVRVKNIQQLQDVYSALYEGNHPYKTVLLDSGTEIQAFAMMETMRLHVDQNPDADPDIPGWQQYGKNLSQMRAIIRGFRDLDMHTIITALQMDDKDNKTGVTVKRPKFTGQFAKEFPALLDVVLYYYMKEIVVDGESIQKRLLLSTRTDSTVAKDRTAKLPQVMEEPTMQKIFDALTEKTTEDSNTPQANGLDAKPNNSNDALNAMSLLS